MMKEQLDERQRRLLYVMHLGCVDARLLAKAGGTTQLYDLMDILELIPSYVVDWSDDSAEILRDEFNRYGKKYPGSREYLRFLYEYPLPGCFGLWLTQ